MRIVLSGGGTGGHVTPLVAVVQRLHKHEPSVESVYLGDHEGEFRRFGLKSHHITSGKWRRYHNRSRWQHLLDYKTLLLNLRDLAKITIGVGQSLFYLLRYRPQVVFCKGGYASLPVGLVAWLLKRPLIIHESDVRAGLTNRILGHLSDRIATGFPTEYYGSWQTGKLIFTGNPLRQEIRPLTDVSAARFGLNDDLPVILVIGGSGGAQALNRAIVRLLPQLTQHYQLIHVSGRRDYAATKQLLEEVKLIHPDRYQLRDYLGEELNEAYNAADVVVSRAGANTLAELALLAKPAILVPAPQLSDQGKNVAVLADHGAALVVKQPEIEDTLQGAIGEIAESAAKRRQLAQAIAALAQANAADKLAKEIVHLGQEGR